VLSSIAAAPVNPAANIERRWPSHICRLALAGLPMLPHFVIVVTADVVALPALLIQPWHCSVRITEPIANIVGALTALYRPLAAAVFQRIIAVPAVVTATIGIHFLRWQVAVRIAHPVTGTQVPAMSARRRANSYAILDLLNQRLAAVIR
jgi:hypothetical protein